MPSLAEYYRGGLRVVAEPGTTFAYSQPRVRHARPDRRGRERDRPRALLPRADLRAARHGGHRPRPVRAGRVAPGDRLRRSGASGAKAVPDRDWIGPRSRRDLLHRPRHGPLRRGAHGRRRQRARLGPPAGDARDDVRAALPAGSSAAGLGLGFARGEAGGHRVVGHDGILPGFNSQLLVAPDDGVAVVAFTNGSSGAFCGWRRSSSGCSATCSTSPTRSIRTDIPHHPEIWDELCGRYRLPARISDLRGRLAIAGGVEVFVRGGRLMIRALTPVPALYRGLPLHPDDEDDPYVFRLDLSGFGMATVRVVFGRDVASGTAAIHADLGGQPLSLIRRPAEGRARCAARRCAERAAGRRRRAIRHAASSAIQGGKA